MTKKHTRSRTRRNRFKGGSVFLPSFSNVDTKSYIPLNSYQMDPQRMVVESRLVGGKKKTRSNKKSQKRYKK